eukprot:m.16315 g.16315  ORF g.16315 m.16315 type:complete len:257 (+) comp26846_c0_seq2:77-847(+)
MGLQHNVGVFRVPRGFLKIIELVFAIVGFAVLADYRETATTKVGKFTVKYAFGDDDFFFQNGSFVFPFPPSVSDVGQYRANGSFYEFVGVVTFLYILGMTACYVFLEVKLAPERLDVYFLVDFIVTAVLAFFWLVCSAVWARAADGIPDIVDKFYNAYSLNSESRPSYGALIVVVVVGFLNFFLWCGNCWFAIKETKWFRQRGNKDKYAERDLRKTARSPATPSGQPEGSSGTEGPKSGSAAPRPETEEKDAVSAL